MGHGTERSVILVGTGEIAEEKKGKKRKTKETTVKREKSCAFAAKIFIYLQKPLFFYDIHRSNAKLFNYELSGRPLSAPPEIFTN